MFTDQEPLFSQLRTNIEVAATKAYEVYSVRYSIPLHLIHRQTILCRSVSEHIIRTLGGMGITASLMEANCGGHYNIGLDGWYLADAMWQQFLEPRPIDQELEGAPRLLIGHKLELPAILRGFNTPYEAISLIVNTHPIH